MLFTKLLKLTNSEYFASELVVMYGDVLSQVHTRTPFITRCIGLANSLTDNYVFNLNFDPQGNCSYLNYANYRGLAFD